MINPLVSIVTINYNNIDGLRRTCNSVFGQTFRELEFIVIDGGSLDGSKEYLELNNNRMNKGILAAQGKYLLFLNSGDEFSDSNALMQFTTKTLLADLIVGDLFNIGLHKQYFSKVPNKLTFSFFYSSSLPHGSTLIRKELFEQVGLYDEELKICSDWKFFLFAFSKFKCSYEYRNTHVTNFYLDGISSNSEMTYKVLAERQTVLSKHFEEELIAYKRKEYYMQKIKKTSSIVFKTFSLFRKKDKN